MADFSYDDTALRERMASEAKNRFSALGWSVFVLITVWFAFMTTVGIVISVMKELGIPAWDFYDRYLMVFNELGLAVGILVSMCILRLVPASEPSRRGLSVKELVTYLAICFSIGMVGNLIGSGLLGLWNGVTGNEAGGEVEEIIESAGEPLLVLMVGLCAPFLEEYFFRKLLVDRMRPFGEGVAIAMSALLFGLFHGNFSQFFYAAGLGALLAYVYLKIGSFFAVFILHALFNLISGILPALLMTSENDDLYVLYMVFYIAMVILGGLLALLHVTEMKVRPAEIDLPRKKRWRFFLGNSGMVAALILMCLIMLMSLFAV